jgi:hypothetical protein
MGSRMPNSMLWSRIVVLSSITAGQTDNWIATHHHHDRVLVRSIRRKLAEDPSSIFQLEHVTRRSKVAKSDVIARVEEIIITNRRMSYVTISETIGDAPELPGISPTMPR